MPKPVPTPTPEQQAAHARLVAAYTELTAAGEALLVLLPEEDKIEAAETIYSLLTDLKPSELMDELGPAYHADQTWDMMFDPELQDDED
jgi:hypothetical protein